jgi:hypothetical protein
MTNLRSRLVRQLSYANVMASIAVFLALGGVGYAASSINGNDIAKRTVGANKLKNATLTSKQIKQNALNGSVIEESSLGTVPSAQTAVSATTAASAKTAASATTASSATTAASASNAEHAVSADHATEATTATSAATAGDADTLDGLTSNQFFVSCFTGTDRYGGMCWDKTARTPTTWIAASIKCGDEGGRLPSLSELIGYVSQEGQQVTGGGHWSGDVIDVNVGGKEVVLTADDTTRGTAESSSLFGYRCIYYEVN